MAEIVDYASPRVTAPSRTSRLAVTCFALSVFTFPCFIGRMLRYLPRSGVPIWILWVAIGLPAALVCAAAIVALVRIRRSEGRLRGEVIAQWAAAISGIGFLGFATLIGVFLFAPWGWLD